MTTEHVTDHVARGPLLLSQQFKNKPVIAALLQSWLQQVQLLEDAAFGLRAQRTLATAEGNNLDVLGAMVGMQRRVGWSDERYRIWIAASIQVNQSSGTPEQLIAIAQKLCVTPIELREYFPAAAIISARGPIAPAIDGRQVAKLLARSKPAAVGLHFRWSTTDNTFRFSATGSSVMDSPHGFGGALAAVSDGVDLTFDGGLVPTPPVIAPGGGALLVIL